MTIEMDKKNAGRAEPLSANSSSTADTDLASVSFSSAAREGAVTETVIFEANGVANTQTVPEVVPRTQGGASVPVTLIYGKNGSIIFQAGEPAVAEGPENDAGEAVAGPSGPNNYNGTLSGEMNSRGADAGESVEFTGTYRLVAA